KCGAGAGRHGHRAPDGFADIVILHVEEDALAAVDEAAHVIHAGRRIKLHADFIEAGAVAESGDERVCIVGRIVIEGDDDGIVWGHLSMIDLLVRSVTRPMRRAAGSRSSRAVASGSGRVISRPPDVWGS